MAQEPLKSIAYFVNWAIYARNHNPSDLPCEQLTHILYAFANIKPDGTVFLTDPWSDTDKHYPTDSWNDTGTNIYGCLKQLHLLKKRHRHLKVLLSIGGWSYSANFHVPASTPTGRQTITRSALTLLEDHGFDGLDLDWEYPADSTQANDYVALLAVVRAGLDTAQQKRGETAHFLLSVACPAGPQNYSKLNIRDMDHYLDFWNLMAYDYAGSWDQRTGHQANLYPDTTKAGCTPYSTSQAVEAYLKAGVPASKLVLGMPLYGRAFCGTEGLGGRFEGTGEGSWEQGVWDFKALPQDGAREEVDEKVGASWSYDAEKRVVVSYDTKEAVRLKADFILERGLGGGMWWESSGDRAVGEGSLIEGFVEGVGGRERLEGMRNCLEYPESRFENLRKGFPGE